MSNELFIGNPNVKGYITGNIVDDNYDVIIQETTFAGRPGNGFSLATAQKDVKLALLNSAEQQGVEVPAELQEWYDNL